MKTPIRYFTVREKRKTTLDPYGVDLTYVYLTPFILQGLVDDTTFYTRPLFGNKKHSGILKKH